MAKIRRIFKMAAKKKTCLHSKKNARLDYYWATLKICKWTTQQNTISNMHMVFQMFVTKLVNYRISYISRTSTKHIPATGSSLLYDLNIPLLLDQRISDVNIPVQWWGFRSFRWIFGETTAICSSCSPGFIMDHDHDIPWSIKHVRCKP